jgi:hypothetical protein
VADVDYFKHVNDTLTSIGDPVSRSGPMRLPSAPDVADAMEEKSFDILPGCDILTAAISCR